MIAYKFSVKRVRLSRTNLTFIPQFRPEIYTYAIFNMNKKIRATRTKYFKRVVYFIITFLVLYACRKNQITIDQNVVQFTSTIVEENKNKAIGTVWENGDQIGVFMIASGQSLSSNSIVNGASNLMFSTDGSTFQSSEELYLPEQSVDFIAYNPFKVIDGYQYGIDVADQSSQSALDLMYAKNAKGINKGNNKIPLIFDRQLSKISIELTISNIDEQQYDQIRVIMPKVNTLGEFDLITGKLDVNKASQKDIDGKVINNHDGTATIEFLLLPGENIAGKTIQFLTSYDTKFTWKLPKVNKLKRGNHYSFDVNVDNGLSDGEIVTKQPFLEIPKISKLQKNELFIQHFLPDDQKRRNYTMLYDKVKKMAYWVAYPLHSSYLGNAKRTDDWQYDPAVSMEFQPTLFKGFGTSGYDRGHQMPSADRNFNNAQNKTTFYFSNMTAQSSKLNQGIWANLESQVRTWTAQCDTLYVVTGAMPNTSTNATIEYIVDNKNKDVAKPKYYFKALAMKKGKNYYTIAYKMDNETPSSNKFETYQMTVRELEQVTGFTFFPDLNAIHKQSINTTIWR